MSYLLSPDDYRKKLLSAFPPEVLRAFMLGTGDAYRAAHEHCKRNFEAEDRHDLIGRTRRAKVHETIRGVADRFRLDARDLPHANNGTTRFLCVTAEEIRLVCCLVSTRRSMVRPSKIRKLWAQQNYDGQQTIFDQRVPQPLDLNLKHLAVLVHAPNGRNKDEAAFVDVVIPDREFRHYNERLDLFAMFPKEAENYRALFRRRRERGIGTA